MASLKQQVDDVNAGLSDLAHFQLGGQMITQDNCVASWYFEKPIMNAPNNRLIVGIGTHPNAIYFDPLRSRSGTNFRLPRPTTSTELSGSATRVSSQATLSLILLWSG